MTAKRPISARRFRWIDSELTALQALGLEDDLADRVRQMYAPRQTSWSRRIFVTLTLLAVLLLGMALFLLVCQNWKFVPPGLRAAGVLTLWGAAAAACVCFRGRRYVSEPLLLALVLCYGLGIWQLAQIFNINTHYTNGLWFWALGVWLTAFAARTRVLPLMGFLLLLVWGFAEVLEPFAGEHLFLSDRVPNMALSLPILSASAWLIYRRRGAAPAAYAYRLLLYLWGLLLTISWSAEEWAVWAIILWSALFLAVRYACGCRRPFAFETMVLAVTLLIASVYEFNAHVARHSVDYLLIDWVLPIVAIPIVATVVANAATVALVVHLLAQRDEEQGRCFALGILIFLIWAFIRYIDLFGTASYLIAAGGFALLALILFGAAALWRAKTRLRKDDEALAPTADTAAEHPLSGPHVGPGAKAGLWILIASIALQGAVLAHEVLSRVLPFRGAETIQVLSVPVDPRDLFRGDYVRLGYTFSTTSGKGTYWNGDRLIEVDTYDVESLDPLPDRRVSPLERKGRPVYVWLVKRDDGLWHPTRMTLTPPDEGLYIKGICINNFEVRYGIETFFVPHDGTGKRFEEAYRSGRASTYVQNKSLKRVVVTLQVNREGAARVVDAKIQDVPVQDQDDPSDHPSDNQEETPPGDP
ncbi:MAG: GDYXXLXY domain-containing protein [Thermoguttaceae bacterium]|nr:GDYXXLXY domain-containing protein [Thermoguttaceae bacterium]